MITFYEFEPNGKCGETEFYPDLKALETDLLNQSDPEYTKTVVEALQYGDAFLIPNGTSGYTSVYVCTP